MQTLLFMFPTPSLSTFLKNGNQFSRKRFWKKIPKAKMQNLEVSAFV